MKKLILGSMVLALMASGSAFADKGFSAGASVAYSNITIKDSGLSVDFNDVGYKIFGAYMFTEHFGVEGSWLDFGNLSENVAGIAQVDINADGFDLFAVGSYPVSDKLDLFGKAGMVSWDASTSLDGVDQGSDNGEDLALGIGVRFNTDSNFGIRGEYEWLDIKDTDSAWLLSVGFEYAFK